MLPAPSAVPPARQLAVRPPEPPPFHKRQQLAYESQAWSDDMRENLFTLSRTQREDMWRRFKQTYDRRVTERLHAILLLDIGQNAASVSSILYIHPKTLKRWIKTFVTSGEEALITLHYAGCDGLMTDEQQQQFTAWLDTEIRKPPKRSTGSRRSLACPTVTAVCANCQARRCNEIHTQRIDVEDMHPLTPSAFLQTHIGIISCAKSGGICVGMLSISDAAERLSGASYWFL